MTVTKIKIIKNVDVVIEFNIDSYNDNDPSDYDLDDIKINFDHESEEARPFFDDALEKICHKIISEYRNVGEKLDGLVDAYNVNKVR